METRDYLSYIVNEIHTTIVATVVDEGKPVTSAIDMMDEECYAVEEGFSNFLTESFESGKKICLVEVGVGLIHQLSFAFHLKSWLEKIKM